MLTTKRTSTRPSLIILLIGLLLGGCSAAKELKERAKEGARQAAGHAVEREVGERTDAAVTGAFDKAEEAVRCAVGDDACINEAKREGRPVVVTDEEGRVVEEIPGAGGTAPVENANANYDFKPGSRVLFAEDFADDNVGDFPWRLEFVKGNWEIVEWQGRRFLRNLGPRASAFTVPLPETLPERFTIEFEASFSHGNQQLAVATKEPEQGRVQYLEGQNFFHLTNAKSGLDVGGEGVEALQRMDNPFAGQVVPVRIMVDGSYAKVYLGEQRVANVPNAVLPRSNTIWFENTYFADAEHPLYIGNIRVAAGGRDLYDALEREGRVTVNDIHFDTGSSQIRPSSTTVLQQIGQMLKAHPDLHLKIEGHTDSAGSESANQQLSQQRAEAVKQFLVSGHDIEATRLEAVGKGEAEPVASNDTAEGRQQNRRVELVRL
jgi:outer membrane protein OmpA-like peptidoglycan-associated protein